MGYEISHLSLSYPLGVHKVQVAHFCLKYKNVRLLVSVEKNPYWTIPNNNTKTSTYDMYQTCTTNVQLTRIYLETAVLVSV